MPDTQRRVKLPFLIALFAAPAILGAATGVFGLMGDYGSRFMLAGALGLIAVLPAWFTAYPWLAWRDPPRPGMKPRVKAALAANFASLVIFPAIIMLLAATGGYEALFSNTGAETVTTGGDLPDAPTPRDAAIASALVAFLLGLVFMPVLAALFAWVERKLGPRHAKPAEPAN